MTGRKLETEQTPSSAPEEKENAPRIHPPIPRPEEPSVRRVGSITLGIVLVLTGAFFLAYYFWPAFDWLLALKLAPPLALAALGVEVLFFSARPGRWKYDFLSVISSLLLMGCCFGLTLLPIVWEQVDQKYERELLCRSYEEQLYEALAEVEQEIPLRNMEVYLDHLDGLEVQLELYGPYETKEEFTGDCRTLLDSFSSLQPRTVTFYWTDRSDPDRGWTGFDLDLTSPVQMDWTAGQMAEQISGYGWRFEDPELPDETENLDEAAETETA